MRFLVHAWSNSARHLHEADRPSSVYIQDIRHEAVRNGIFRDPYKNDLLSPASRTDTSGISVSTLCGMIIETVVPASGTLSICICPFILQSFYVRLQDLSQCPPHAGHGSYLPDCMCFPVHLYFFAHPDSGIFHLYHKIDAV